MGRHAVGPQESPPDPAPPRLGWRARFVLAGAVALTTLLAMSWSGAPWWIAGAAAVGGAVVVLVAAWVAGTLPGPPPPPSDPVQ